MAKRKRKRKIRYDRIILCILIPCCILFGLSRCTKKDDVSTQNEQTSSAGTVQDFLKTALKPVGKTMYIYGGGWNEKQTGAGKEAVTLGLSSQWKQFYKAQDESYDYENYMYQIHDGLDCAGYVGWAIYNTLETKNNQEGYVMKAQDMSQEFANQGLGTYQDSIDNAKPGDIVSMANAHVYIVLGKCEDGSLLIVHSSPPGVKISGTGKEAVKLAKKIMKTYYPKWYKQYPDCKVDSSFTQSDNVSLFHWNKKTLQDPDNLTKKNADQVVQILFERK